MGAQASVYTYCEADVRYVSCVYKLYTLPFHSRTPALYHELDKVGAVWGQRMGWEVPLWFAAEGQGVCVWAGGGDCVVIIIHLFVLYIVVYVL